MAIHGEVRRLRAAPTVDRVWRTLALSCLSATALTVLLRTLSGADSESLIDTYVGMMFEVDSVDQLSAAARGFADIVVSITSPLIHYYPVVAFANRALLLVVVATLVYMAMGFIDARLPWSAAAMATAVASLVHDLARTIAMGAAAMVAPPSFEEVLTGDFGRAPVAAFFDADSRPLLAALSSSVDVASIAFMVALAGMLSESVEPRVRRGAVASVIGCLYVIYLVGRSGWQLAWA